MADIALCENADKPVFAIKPFNITLRKDIAGKAKL